MKIFDLSNISKEELNLPEFIDYLILQDKVEIYRFCLHLLDEGFTLSGDKVSEVENFLTNPKIYTHMRHVWEFVEEEDLIDYSYSEDPKYLAISIAHLRNNGYHNEALKKLEEKYYIKKQRKAKLKNIDKLYEKECC
jgi:hypothetical protein